MFKNYVKVAVRNLLKHKTYSLLNLSGLALGVACSILILLWIQDELSYDRHFQESDRIYRLNVEYTIGNKVDQYANVPRPLGPTLQRDFPEVEQAARVRKISGLTSDTVLLRDAETPDREVEEELVFWADSTFFSVFQHDFLQGRPESALNARGTAVVTRRFAHRLFGDQPPLNRTFTLNDDQTFRITGVIADPPEQTHLRFEVLLSWATFHTERDLTRWLGGHVFTYLLLQKNPDLDAFLAKWPAFFAKYMKPTFDQIGGSCRLMVQPLADIHLRSRLQWEVAQNGNIVYVYVFLAVGLFILVIACINYMNLATARSARRSSEVGIRKVFGAPRHVLVRQFLNESAVYAVLSVGLGLLIALALLPYFNQFTGKHMALAPFANPLLFLGLAAITVFVALFSGSYPALYLSAILPVRALRAHESTGASRSLLRRVLVVCQFAISIIIIAGTGVVRDQLQYARQKDLGFNKDHICVVTLRESVEPGRIPAIKSELLQHPAILQAATSYDIPGAALNHTALEIETADGEWQQQPIQFMQIDHDFIELMQMEIQAGRNFERGRTTDSTQSVLINQAAVAKFGLRNPVGKRVRFGPEDVYSVVGVVNDIHMDSFRAAIEPVVMFLPERAGGKLYLRMHGETIDQALAFLQEKWPTYDATFPLDYVFLDAYFYKVHESDQKLFQMFGDFSLVAILISCLGLFGLASFSTAQRTKEIGVRKVLGASVGSVVLTVVREFITLMLVSMLVAWPIAYFVMNRWLQDFAYRVELRPETFLLAGAAALIVALLTISFQSIKAALANPVTSLRYE